MISSLLHLVGLRPPVHYTLTNFKGGGGGGGQGLFGPPQYANVTLAIELIQVQVQVCPGHRW